MGAKRIAITGAEGVIGTVLRRGLADAYEVVAMTRTPQSFPHLVADVTDLAALRRSFAGVSAVVHLAAVADLSAGWEDVLAVNMVGTRNVYEAARLAGVESVVFASSGHVLGAAEERAGPGFYALDDARQFNETTPPEPDSVYAVGKLFGETLGRHYAEAYRMRVICIRFGTVLPDDDPRSAAAGRGRSAALPLAERYPRIRAKWLSHRDCCQLVRCAIEAAPVRYAVVYGTSANPRQIWSLASARGLLGYAPQDAAPRDTVSVGGGTT
jgi:nucleoside-diphosphate-sugar epimerase